MNEIKLIFNQKTKIKAHKNKFFFFKLNQEFRKGRNKNKDDRLEKQQQINNKKNHLKFPEISCSFLLKA